MHIDLFLASRLALSVLLLKPYPPSPIDPHALIATRVFSLASKVVASNTSDLDRGVDFDPLAGEIHILDCRLLTI